MTEPPFKVKVHMAVICFFDRSTRVGASLIVGFDAIMNVFLIENSPSPARETALILY
jgi:hypothetical protein